MSAANLRKIDAICIDFEKACLADKRPLPERLLLEVSPDLRVTLLKELLKLEIHYSKAIVTDLETYAERFPDIDRQTLKDIIPAIPRVISPQIPG